LLSEGTIVLSEGTIHIII